MDFQVILKIIKYNLGLYNVLLALWANYKYLASLLIQLKIFCSQGLHMKLNILQEVFLGLKLA